MIRKPTKGKGCLCASSIRKKSFLIREPARGKGKTPSSREGVRQRKEPAAPGNVLNHSLKKEKLSRRNSDEKEMEARRDRKGGGKTLIWKGAREGI